MQLQGNRSDLPDFIVKSTMGVALITSLLLTPFGINNLVQDRYLLGVLTLAISAMCLICAWQCFRGKYSFSISLYGIAPTISITIILATYELGVRGSYWAFLVVLGLHFILPRKWALVSNILFAGIIIPIAFHVIEFKEAIRFASVLVGTSVFATVTMYEIFKQHYLIQEKASTDSLTGLFNRSSLQDTLEMAIEHNRETAVPYTLLMLDIDDFKTINDKHGHDVGDIVLQSVGSLLRKSFVQGSKTFRIGGEEFLVLVPNIEKGKVYEAAENLRQKTEELNIIPGHTLTVSIGVAEVKQYLKWTEWIKQCDKKLYGAKSNGKNQVFS